MSAPTVVMDNALYNDNKKKRPVMKKFYDYIIVGSGASGGALSYFLSRSGAKVLMLEAGKRYAADTFSSNEMHANSRLMWGGGTEMNTDADQIFLRGKVVGGGTIINQCLLDRFDDVAYNDWRTQSGVGFHDLNTMNRHYDEVESHLSLYTMQKQDWNGNAELYAKAFDNLGLEHSPLRRGQSNCNSDNDCIVCLGGCSRKSKQSTLETFIPKAEKEGLTLISEFEVAEVIHGESFVTVQGSHKGEATTYYGRKCIIASGAVGTTKLLLKSQLQKKLPALGKNFHCHPQWMTLAFFNDTVDSHKGFFQTLKSSDPRFRQWGFKLENVFAGPIALALLKQGYGGDHQQFMQRLRNMACIEVAVRDQDPGEISLNNAGKVVIKKTLSDGDRQRANHGNRLVNDMFKSLGAYEVMTSPMQIGLHLMGGCTIGQNAATSVVNEGFEVHGMKNIYIADSSTFPNAPGVNPMLTILALAHRASETILAEAGQRTTASRTTQKMASKEKAS